MCGGICDGRFLLHFYIQEVLFLEQNIKVSEKLNNKKILAYMLCTTLIFKYHLNERHPNKCVNYINLINIKNPKQPIWFTIIQLPLFSLF